MAAVLRREFCVTKMTHLVVRFNPFLLSSVGFISSGTRLALCRSHMLMRSSKARPVSSLTRCLSSNQNHVSIPAKKNNVLIKRQSSNISQGIGDSGNTNWNLVYEGPLSKSVKYIKGFSLTTAAASLAGSPILVYFGKQSVPLIGKLAIGGLLCIIGSSTTVILHWFTKAYVHRMYFNSARQVFSVETSSFFGRSQRTEFEVKDIVFPEEEGAFSTFEAKDKKFFLHQEMVEAQQVLHFVREAQT